MRMMRTCDAVRLYLQTSVKMAERFSGLKRVPVSKTSLVVALLSLCLVLAVSTLPFSLLFSSLHDKGTLRSMVADLNAQRTKDALDFLSLIPRKTPQELRAMSQPGNSSFRFTIAIITVSRRRPNVGQKDLGYVLQTAASLLSLVKRKKAFRDSFVFVCNMDRNPDSHADAVTLKDFFPYVERFGSSTIPNVSDLPIPGTEQLYRNTQYFNGFQRELHDYMFCLQVAHRYSSEYYLILQDDAVLRPEFSEVLEHSLAKLTKAGTCRHAHTPSSPLHLLLPSRASCLLDRPPYSSPLVPQTRTVSPSPNSSFAFIKFYFPERWQGFAFEAPQLLDLASLGAVGGGLGLLIHAVWAVRRQQVFRPGRRAFLLGIAISLSMSYIVGRQNLNALRRCSKYLYRLQTSPHCCIPAMLYPAPVMPFLVTWLAESPEGSLVDLRISDCFVHYQVPGYYVEPNIVQHVGMVSSLPKTERKDVEEFLMF